MWGHRMGCLVLVPVCCSSMQMFASKLKHASKGVATVRNRQTGSLATTQCCKKIRHFNHPEPFHHPPSQMPLETRDNKHWSIPSRWQGRTRCYLHSPPHAKTSRWAPGATLGGTLWKVICKFYILLTQRPVFKRSEVDVSIQASLCTTTWAGARQTQHMMLQVAWMKTSRTTNGMIQSDNFRGLKLHEIKQKMPGIEMESHRSNRRLR